MLRDRGNTVFVVEHDEETIRAADHIIDIGPAAGRNGGNITAQGGYQDSAILRIGYRSVLGWSRKDASSY